MPRPVCRESWPLADAFEDDAQDNDDQGKEAKDIFTDHGDEFGDLVRTTFLHFFCRLIRTENPVQHDGGQECADWNDVD